MTNWKFNSEIISSIGKELQRVVKEVKIFLRKIFIKLKLITFINLVTWFSEIKALQAQNISYVLFMLKIVKKVNMR